MTAFERATEIVARQLASFRLGLDCADPHAYTDHEKLCAGHIVGALWGQDMLKTGNEVWVPVETESSNPESGTGLREALADELEHLASQLPPSGSRNACMQAAAALRAPQPERLDCGVLAIPPFLAGHSDNDDPCKAHLVFREPLSREHHAEIARRVVDPGAPQPVNVPAARRSPSHCQICGLTDAEYAHTAKICSDPWHTVPSDYVLMPREATHAMTMAGCDSLPSCEHVFGHAGEMLKNAYQKMVAVAAENVPREEGGARLPEIPDDDSDFTPDLARKIIAKYQELLASRPPHGWQDVGMAPKDGTHFIAIVYSWWEPVNGNHRWMASPAFETCFNSETGLFETPGLKQPTHWMPLPASPLSQGAVTGPSLDTGDAEVTSQSRGQP